MRSLEQPLHFNMVRLQMWLQFPVSTMITLHCVPSLTLPTDIAMHRVVIIPRRPHRLFRAVRQLQTCLRLARPRSRHEPSPRVNALHSTQQTEKTQKPQTCMR
jgi:hypothetical protein